MRNGYALAHLARSLGGPSCQGPIYNVSVSQACSPRTFDKTPSHIERLQDPVRHFRHTANINIFFELLNEAKLPEVSRRRMSSASSPPYRG